MCSSDLVCQPQRQPNLMRNGLYVNNEGEIKQLPSPIKPHVPSENAPVVVPLPDKKDVEPQPRTPFVIDLSLSTHAHRNNCSVITIESTITTECAEPVQPLKDGNGAVHYDLMLGRASYRLMVITA